MNGWKTSVHVSSPSSGGASFTQRRSSIASCDASLLSSCCRQSWSQYSEITVIPVSYPSCDFFTILRLPCDMRSQFELTAIPESPSLREIPESLRSQSRSILGLRFWGRPAIPESLRSRYTQVLVWRLGVHTPDAQLELTSSFCHEHASILKRHVNEIEGKPNYKKPISMWAV